MKKIFVLFSLVLLLFSRTAQGYDLFPDSTGNKVNLRITNTGSFVIPQAKVTKQSLPSWVANFAPAEVMLGNIGVNQSATASFTFDIPSTAQIGASGNLQFQVTAESGDSWSKNVGLTVINPNGAISGDVDVEGITETPNGAILTYTGPKNGSIILGITRGYTISNLPGGSYRVSVSKSGFVPIPAYRDVTVTLGQTTSGIDFNMIRPPQAPTLSSPANSSNVNTPRPNLDWNNAEGGGNKRYQIQVALNNSFASIVIDASNITNTDYTPTSDLANNTLYYWRVRTSNEAGTSEWSSIWGFTTRILPSKPGLSSPSNGSTISSLQPAFDWSDSFHATSYKIQVDNNNDFSSCEINISGLTNSGYSHTSNLSANTTYYWRACASNAVGDSTWSDRWSFNTPGPPSAPSLSSPSNGSTISDSDDVSLSWNSVSNASSYRLQVANNSSFSNPAVDTTQSYTSYTAWNLSNNTTYYWRVLAKNSIGDSPWSSAWWFKIDLKGKIKGDVDSPDTWGQYNATVQAVGPMTRSATTGLAGGYTISDLTPGNYTVTCSKSGYTVSPVSRSVTVTAGQTTDNIDFDLTPVRANATILLSSDSIRNASSYRKGLAEGTPTPGLFVPPILASGRAEVLLKTLIPLPNTPSLSYTIDGETKQINLSGTGTNWTGQMYIESTTPCGTATFHYSAMDESGSVSTQIEQGQEFVIDTTIYPDEGGEVSNQDGSAIKVRPKILSVPINIRITSPQIPKVSLPFNHTILPETARQFRALPDIGIGKFTIILPYKAQKGLDEEKIKVGQLKNDGSIRIIEESYVDKEKRIVTAEVDSLGIYILVYTNTITDINSIICYPNPWYPEKDTFVKITFIPLNSNPRVYIYNIAGELVRTLEGSNIFDTGQGYLEARWDGRNDNGRTVAYGVYIYVAETDKGTRKGKIGVIR